MDRALSIALCLTLAACGRGPAGAQQDKGSTATATAQPAKTQPAWAFDPAAFDPLGPPPKGGWRTQVDEPSQSLADYQASAPNRPTPPRSVLVLQPLTPYPDRVILAGDLPALQVEEEGFISYVFSPEPDDLARFIEAFYGLEARVAEPVPLPSTALVPARVRQHHTQYDARGLLEALRPSLPADAYSMTLLLARDLVVSEDQEYAFGYGLHRERLAVASFAQLDPLFCGRPRAEDFQQRIRERGHKLVAHEVGHTLGIQHCQEHACVMNGIAHIDELDLTPLRLCPVCLRKLEWLLDEGPLDARARYEALAAYYGSVGLESERAWVEARLAP